MSHMMRGAALTHYQESHAFNRQLQQMFQDRCFMFGTFSLIPHTHMSPALFQFEKMLLLHVNYCDL